MREIIFDTETTGLSAAKGDRIVEIGAIELINKFPTGNIYHQYINAAGHPIHPDAERIHGISAEFLSDKPVFAEIAEEFIEFFKDAKLIAHNASFDMSFVNAELKRAGMRPFSPDVVIDTLQIARRKHPMGPNSLDALCRRYGVDNSHREKHGALLDSELLAEVYIELLGGKQANLEFEIQNNSSDKTTDGQLTRISQKTQPRPVPLKSMITQDEISTHQEFIETLGENSTWKRYKN